MQTNLAPVSNSINSEQQDIPLDSTAVGRQSEVSPLVREHVIELNPSAHPGLVDCFANRHPHVIAAVVSSSVVGVIFGAGAVTYLATDSLAMAEVTVLALSFVFTCATSLLCRRPPADR